MDFGEDAFSGSGDSLVLNLVKGLISGSMSSQGLGAIFYRAQLFVVISYSTSAVVEHYARQYCSAQAPTVTQH